MFEHIYDILQLISYMSYPAHEGLTKHFDIPAAWGALTVLRPPILLRAVRYSFGRTCSTLCAALIAGTRCGTDIEYAGTSCAVLMSGMLVLAVRY
eukprot:3940474-Rhodomonas_salina.2